MKTVFLPEVMIVDKTHSFEVGVVWTGNDGRGTAGYTAYERSHEIIGDGKAIIFGSSDPAFRGDKSRYNPEELLVASLSACHMLWYLNLCANARIIVTDYTDKAGGIMVITEDGGGQFTGVTLKPAVTVTEDADLTMAAELHRRAHQLCFIANSVNFPIRVEATILVEGSAHEDQRLNVERRAENVE